MYDPQAWELISRPFTSNVALVWVNGGILETKLTIHVEAAPERMRVYPSIGRGLEEPELQYLLGI